MTNCVFCKIIRGEAPAKVIWEWEHGIIFVPLNPVTRGHLLVVPKIHVADFMSSPEVTAEVMRYAAKYADYLTGPFNLITSAGVEATQTVFHFHAHLVPRREGDGLRLPWTGQVKESAP